MKANQLFTLPKSLELFKTFFDENEDVWNWLSQISKALNSFELKSLPNNKQESQIPANVYIKGDVFIHESVVLPPLAYIQGPCYIGANTELRPNAYIRGNVIIGENCVIGNSCEYKNSLLMDNVQTPHYNYVGDSILGSNSHTGAGCILANLRLDKKNVPVQTKDKTVKTSLRKIGAFMGEGAEAGCNSVLNPGTILSKKSVVLSGISFNGFLDEEKIVFKKDELKIIPRKFLF